MQHLFSLLVIPFDQAVDFPGQRGINLAELRRVGTIIGRLITSGLRGRRLGLASRITRLSGRLRSVRNIRGRGRFGIVLITVRHVESRVEGPRAFRIIGRLGARLDRNPPPQCNTRLSRWTTSSYSQHPRISAIRLERQPRTRRNCSDG